jgi:Ca-activated chloride channel family protein
MRGIAEQTGGRYFRARDVKELENIYQMLDELEPVERDKRYYRPQTELYPWPLGAALLLAILIALQVLRQGSGRMDWK